MFTSSGLIVRFLKVFEKSNYHSIKWVRYLTKASGSYQIRVGSHDFLGNLALTLAALLHLYHSFSGIGWIFHPVVVLSYSVVCGNVVLTVYMYVGGRSTEMAQFVVRVIFVVVCTWNERFDWRVSKRHLNYNYLSSSAHLLSIFRFITVGLCFGGIRVQAYLEPHMVAESCWLQVRLPQRFLDRQPSR